MAVPKDVKILQISTDDLDLLNEGQIAFCTAEDAELGIKLWGGKSHVDGVTSKWLQLDENARVKQLMFNNDDGKYNGLVGSNINTQNINGITGLPYEIDHTMVVGNYALEQMTGDVTNSPILGVCAAFQSEGLINSVVIGTSAACYTKSTNSVYIGHVAGASEKLNTSNGMYPEVSTVAIGSYAANGNGIGLGSGVIVGNNAGRHISVDASETVHGLDDIAPDGARIWNLIAIGDGAGSNITVTSGSASIYIGKNAGNGVGYGSVNSTFIGNGCCVSAFTLTNKERHRRYAVGGDSALGRYNTEDYSTALLSGKIVFESVYSNFLDINNVGVLPSPSMVINQGRKINSSKFFGPLHNTQGNLMGSSCMCVIQPNLLLGGIKMSMYDFMSDEYVADGAIIDCYRYQNVLLSACDEVFMSDPTKVFTIPIRIGADAHTKIMFVGDTRHYAPQLSFDISESDYQHANTRSHEMVGGDPQYAWANAGSTHYHLGDTLWGFDHQAREIDISTIDYETDSGTALRVVTTQVKHVPQINRYDISYMPRTMPYARLDAVGDTEIRLINDGVALGFKLIAATVQAALSAECRPTSASSTHAPIFNSTLIGQWGVTVTDDGDYLVINVPAALTSTIYEIDFSFADSPGNWTGDVLPTMLNGYTAGPITTIWCITNKLIHQLPLHL
jgi:hypothetical protein